MASVLMAGCSAENEPQQEVKAPVVVDFALTVAKQPSSGSSGTTRMTAANLTGETSNVELCCVIPFIDNVKNGEVLTSFTREHQTQPFFISSCDFESGVNRVSAYGRDRNHEDGQAKGALVETYSDFEPANIGFRLKTIQTRDAYLGISETSDIETVPEQLADYLTAIAKASIGEGDGVKTWKENATDSKLKLMYKNFINQLTGDVGDALPGSSANVKAWVIELKTKLGELDLTEGSDDAAIRTRIIALIDEKLDALTQDWNNFPAKIGLPDGAAVLRWTGEKFEPETQTTTIADINNIERFTFPAKIYYYGNSPTMVSGDDLTDNFSSKSKWQKANDDDTDAALYGFTEGPITATTKTVAMKEPLHYAVAQLQLQLKQTSSGTLNDSKNTPIEVGNNFKLTSIIVGGQLPVGSDFTPESAMTYYSEADMSFIYDSQVNTNGANNSDPSFYLSATADASSTINTLVLQSWTHRSLKLVLEFEYNGANPFEGFNGSVYPGTKFYIVGEINPDSPVSVNDKEAAQNRVFTKDYITTVTANVTSLSKAYNVLPNLMSPRLEMGLELTPKWIHATTTDVIL